MSRCVFCRKDAGELVHWGEPRRVGISRGSTRYRMVQRWAHQPCIEVHLAFDAASRARSAAEDAAMFAEAFARIGAVPA